MFVLQYVNSTANHSAHCMYNLCVSGDISDMTRLSRSRNRERPWMDSISQCDSRVLNFQQVWHLKIWPHRCKDVKS